MAAAANCALWTPVAASDRSSPICPTAAPQRLPISCFRPSSSSVPASPSHHRVHRSSLPTSASRPFASSLTPAPASASSTSQPLTASPSSSSSPILELLPPLSDPSLAITYLEGNSWLWQLDGARFLVDPVIEGPLDFGIPLLYEAHKRVLTNLKLEDVVDVDVLLLTQGLDDHCHVRTMQRLADLRPDLQVVASPSCRPVLEALAFTQVTYLPPGASFTVYPRSSSPSSPSPSPSPSVCITATAGPVLGPPWQMPENGYLLRGSASGASLFLEPHCASLDASLAGLSADVVLTPVVKQLLPAFTLVSGQEDAVRMATLLGAKVVVPMANGELDATGVLDAVVSQEGTLESFCELMAKANPSVRVLPPTPGVPVLPLS